MSKSCFGHWPLQEKCKVACVTVLVLILWGSPATGGDDARTPSLSDYKVLIEQSADRDEAFWRRVATDEPSASTGSRKFMAYALTLCETRRHPERLDRLFAFARQMQDRDPNSRGFGNLKWYWRDAGVTDANAVEFCAQDALLIWLRHGDWLPEAARRELREWLVLSIEGCMRHAVPTSYTNIAILNAGNLIVLGERFDRPEVAAAGYRRLDGVCLWTAALGTHEYCSPTYYGVNLNGLLFLEANAQQQRQRKQARALLQLFWTDIALNWFPAAERPGGCNSRTYDYVRGLGALDWHLWVHGWLTSKTPGSAERTEPHWKDWTPPGALRPMSFERFPRLVRQSWGILPAESRTHMMYKDVCLSISGACYGSQDIPLAVDLPGPRKATRCYFIADGREDPYGTKKYETGSAKHLKALHLIPFWAAAQRTCDAVGLVVYRKEDISAPQVTNLQSHLVLRRAVDGFWLGGNLIAIPHGTPARPAAVPIRPGEPLVFRQGTAAVGIRVPWAAARDGRLAKAALVDDENALGCVRLMIEHGPLPSGEERGTLGNAPHPGPLPEGEGDFRGGAALWVRVGSGLESDQAFETWRKQFENAAPTACEASAQRLRVEVPGVDGPVSIEAAAPYGTGGPVRLVPKPCRGTLELDGVEIGRPLLAAVEPLRSYTPGTGPLATIKVPSDTHATWEAEAGLVLPGAAVIADDQASGGRCVCEAENARRKPTGSVLWSLDLEKPGRYFLWARLRAADEKHNSFSVGLLGEDGELPQRGFWDFPPSDNWQWQPLRLDRSPQPTPLDLPAGPCRIQFRVREAGARIDRLMLTPDPKEKPL